MVLLAVGEQLGPVDPRYVRAASGLAGGVGGSHQEVCGALSGGVVLIGALYGRESADDPDEPLFSLAGRFRDRFRAAFGETHCEPLRDANHEPGSPGSCKPMIRQACVILWQVLHESEQQPAAAPAGHREKTG